MIVHMTGKSHQKANAKSKAIWALEPLGFFGKYSLSRYSEAVGAAVHVWFNEGHSVKFGLDS